MADFNPKNRRLRLLHFADLDGVSRKLFLIAPEEIALEVQRVLEDAYGISSDELPKSVSRLFGFERVTQEMKEYLGDKIIALAASGKVIVADGEVTIPR